MIGLGYFHFGDAEATRRCSISGCFKRTFDGGNNHDLAAKRLVKSSSMQNTRHVEVCRYSVAGPSNQSLLILSIVQMI